MNGIVGNLFSGLLVVVIRAVDAACGICGKHRVGRVRPGDDAVLFDVRHFGINFIPVLIDISDGDIVPMLVYHTVLNGSIHRRKNIVEFNFCIPEIVMQFVNAFIGRVGRGGDREIVRGRRLILPDP